MPSVSHCVRFPLGAANRPTERPTYEQGRIENNKSDDGATTSSFWRCITARAHSVALPQTRLTNAFDLIYVQDYVYAISESPEHDIFPISLRGKVPLNGYEKTSTHLVRHSLALQLLSYTLLATATASHLYEFKSNWHTIAECSFRCTFTVFTSTTLPSN